ncbi:MAG: hypothetical protein ABH837_03945 [bacterium]
MLDNIIELLKVGFISVLGKIGDFYTTIAGSFNVWAVLDIFITTIIFWWVFSLLRSEKTKKVILLMLILTMLYLCSDIFDLTLLNLIVKYLAIMFVVSLPIIFNRELQSYFLDKKIKHNDHNSKYN